MNVEFDCASPHDEASLGPLASHRQSIFEFLARRQTTIGLLTIKNADIDKKFLQKWIKSTNGYRTTVIHVTFEFCDFSELEPAEICNFLFRFIRAISMKIEGRVDHFVHELLEDDRISKLHNIRIISKQKILMDDDVLLARLFKPGELEVLELRKIQLTDLFVNKLIQRFRETTRTVRCINRLFLGGDIPWPLHQLNFAKQHVQTRDRNKYRFKNRFGYYTLNVEYGNHELDLKIDDSF